MLSEMLHTALLRAKYALPVGRKGAPAPCLPQQDPTPNRRAFELATIRSFYTYLPPNRSDNSCTPIAMSARFPLWEQYGLSWALPYLPKYLRAVTDTTLKKSWWKLRALVGAPVDKLDAYRSIFSELFDLPPPPAVDDWKSDAFFARNRVDGPNPLLLTRIRSLDELQVKMGIIEAEFESVMGSGRTLAQEVDDGNLFVADYKMVQTSLLPETPSRRDSRWRGKYLPAPVALFCQRAVGRSEPELQAVAIRIDQPDAQGPNPLYLRSDEPRWMLAKTFVESAEFNLQAMSTHIYRQHCIAEPFAMTTRRQLSTRHPVYVLLEPHLAYTLAVNSAAFGLMNEPGSVFDTIYGGELAETRQLMVKSYAHWTVREMALEADLVARGVDVQPQDYPYRDDARLWLPVIEAFVSDYLQLYYNNINAVSGDWELQAWYRELTSLNGGALRGLVQGDKLASREQLVELLSQFLFVAGPGHAAVHYPQTDFFTYVPAYPGVMQLPPPASETVTPRRLIDSLPPVEVGADQFENNQIANYRYDQFGHYSKYPLGSVAAAQPAIRRLQTGLASIESTIAERNKTRSRPYPYLLPSLVPNSINI